LISLFYRTKRKMYIILERKINNIVFSGRKIKYLNVACTSSLVIEKKK